MTEPTPESKLSALTSELTEEARREPTALDDAVHELSDRLNDPTTQKPVAPARDFTDIPLAGSDTAAKWEK